MIWRTRSMDVALAAAVVAGVTVVIGAVESVSHVSNVANLYVIVIAVLASRRGLFPAVVASVLAFLVFDWFFIPPLHVFTVDDPSEYVALVTLLVTSVIIGQLLAHARKQAEEARSLQRQTQLLYELSQATLSNPDPFTVYPLALWRLNEGLGVVGSRLLLRAGADLHVAATAGAVPPLADEASWLQRVGEEGRPLAVFAYQKTNVRVGRELDLTAQESLLPNGERLVQLYVPLRVLSGLEGVLIVGERKDGATLPAKDRQLLLAFANQLAIAVERQTFAEQQARARALEESDRLKTALISSVSHELKTPLAAIKLSATTLLDDSVGPDEGLRREVAESINRETDRLTRLVSNLLDVSRLEGGALRPQIECVSIADVVADVLDRMEPMLESHDVRVEIPDDPPATPMDFVQISQVLTNLLDNALRYAPVHASISISAAVVREQLRVTVFNEGSRIPRPDLDRLFDKFYRLSTLPGGIGLGLSIARGIVEAHGGRIWAENVGHRGVAFTFTLPSPHVRPLLAAPAGTADASRA